MNDQLFMETYTGQRFLVLCPTPDMVQLADIAHPLSMMVRFTGQCRYFYSVAQHSINVSREIARHGYSPLYQLYGLLHDASEAYLADINRPVKYTLPEYAKLESKVQSVIWEAFGLPDPNEDILKVVRYFDDTMLYNEARVLMPCKHWNHHTFEVFPYTDISERVMQDIEKEFVDLHRLLNKWAISEIEKSQDLSNKMTNSTNNDNNRL